MLSVLFGAREVGWFGEVAAKHSNHLRFHCHVLYIPMA